jgi:hypothetical protein
MLSRFFWLCLIFAGPLFLCESEEIVWKGVHYNDKTVSQLITVITSTSPVQSAPDTTLLYEAQKSLFKVPALAQCKKIIVFDGIRKKEKSEFKNKYEEYKKKITQLTRSDPYFANTKLVFCSSRQHLSGAIREAIRLVDTPFVFIHQHDLVLLKEFDLNGLLASMIANPLIKHVHLYSLPNHDTYFPADQTDEIVEGPHFVPLCRTSRWTDQSHIASLDYYKNFVLPQCNKNFMERRLHPALEKAMHLSGWEGHREFGTYLYGNLEDGLFIKHTDGRYYSSLNKKE